MDWGLKGCLAWHLPVAGGLGVAGEGWEVWGWEARGWKVVGWQEREWEEGKWEEVGLVAVG